jgi:hypothetical protein
MPWTDPLDRGLQIRAYMQDIFAEAADNEAAVPHLTRGS